MYKQGNARGSSRSLYNSNSGGNRYGGRRGGSGGSGRGGFGGRNRSRGNRGGKSFREADLFNASAFISSGSQHTHLSEWKAVEAAEQLALAELSVHPGIISNMERRGYLNLTPIQSAAIPLMSAGKEIVGLANTGTGKTAAFLIPIIDAIMTKPGTALIMAPTRELALQIQGELFEFAKGLQLRSVLVIGGASMQRQMSELRRRPHFIIGTPGRIKDLNNRGIIKIGVVEHFVLDEADRMLDMGFVADIRYILQQRPEHSRTHFFSATLDHKVNSLLREFSRDPQVISVLQEQTAKSVKQSVVTYRSDEDKMVKLSEMLRDPSYVKTLIFARTKRGADRLSLKLSKEGHRVDAIHGDKRQSQRQRVLSAFRDDKLQHLVATDVAARGLDIKDVTHVINFDLPATKEDYIHRIGRTGRAGKEGAAVTFTRG